MFARGGLNRLNLLRIPYASVESGLAISWAQEDLAEAEHCHTAHPATSSFTATTNWAGSSVEPRIPSTIHYYPHTPPNPILSSKHISHSPAELFITSTSSSPHPLLLLFLSLLKQFSFSNYARSCGHIHSPQRLLGHHLILYTGIPSPALPESTASRHHGKTRTFCVYFHAHGLLGRFLDTPDRRWARGHK